MAGLGLALAATTGQGQFITAHRGGSHAAPENTLAAFSLAWEEDADAIEADFHLTADGRIICIHDRDTERVAGVRRVVADTPLAELRTLDAGRWFDERFAGERLPTFAEVLAAVPAGKRFVVELKTGPEIVPVLAEELERLPCDRERLLIISFKADTIAACKRRFPEIRAHWLSSFKEQDDGRWKPTADVIAETARECRADGVGLRGERRVVDGEFIASLREHGVDEFHVWTIDEADDARFFRDLGAIGITTNKPGLIRRSLETDEAAPAAATDRTLDLVLAGGTVHRGDGSEPFAADVGVRDGTIVEITTDRRLDGSLTLECTGLVVTADQYTYAASSTSLEATLFPAWARDGGAAGLGRRLADPETSARIRAEVERSLAARTRVQLVSCARSVGRVIFAGGYTLRGNAPTRRSVRGGVDAVPRPSPPSIPHHQK